MSLLTQKNESMARFKAFLEASDSVRTLAARLGISVLPVLDLENPSFLRLNTADQAAVLERLKIYSGLLEQASSAELLDEKKLLWFALSRLRLAPPSDLLDMMQEGDLIEVYVGDRQVYRSFNYYNYCSYSLDELETIPWSELFARDEQWTNEIFKEIGSCLGTRKVITSQVPAHEVREIRSAYKNKFLYQLKYIVPLNDKEGGKPDCILGILRAQVLDGVHTAEREAQVKKYFERRLAEFQHEA